MTFEHISSLPHELQLTSGRVSIGVDNGAINTVAEGLIVLLGTYGGRDVVGVLDIADDVVVAEIVVLVAGSGLVNALMVELPSEPDRWELCEPFTWTGWSSVGDTFEP